MPKAPQEPSRPLTRSMKSSTIRRSSRLRSDGRRHSSPPPSLLLAPPAPSVRRGTKKPRRPSAAVDAPNSGSRKACEQIRAQDEPRSLRGASRQNAASGRSSVPTIKPPICSRGSVRVRELEQQLGVALQAKQELTIELDEHKSSAAQLALKHLEEYFTCPLCFEILACPYAMTPRNCGHTFCATCILKWFFSRLHKGCGGWHEPVDCPLCRSALPHTPERVPRSTASFPFTPNRTADTAIRGLINNISHNLDTASTVAPSPQLSDWSEDGHIKQEWSRRERAGRTEMTSIAAQWNTLKPTDFVNIKGRLEV